MIHVKGTAVEDLLALLGEAAGLTLAGADGQIVIGDELPLGPGMSGALRARLTEMIEAEDRYAQVDARASSGIHFGDFLQWQLVNVGNAVGINAGRAVSGRRS